MDTFHLLMNSLDIGRAYHLSTGTEVNVNVVHKADYQLTIGG